MSTGAPVGLCNSIASSNGGAVRVSTSFTLTVANAAPTISNVTDQSTNEDTATSAIAVTVGDVDSRWGNSLPDAFEAPDRPKHFSFGMQDA